MTTPNTSPLVPAAEYLPPEPLQPDLASAAPYPIEALPALMRAGAQAIAYHVQVPLELAAQCVIGAAVYLAQTRVNAPHIHRPEGMPASMFQLTLADSGARKSECRRMAFKPIDEAEKEARQNHRQACKDITDFASGLDGKPLKKYLAENPLPVDPRTQYTDATFEPIAGAFIRGMAAASWDTDEGGQMLGGASLKADTRAATLGSLVKVNDDGSIERTRAGGNVEGSGFASHRRLSIHLLAQPVTVAEALSDPLLRGQGFLPRFLFASPACLAGSRFTTAEKLAEKAYSDPRLQRYWARCEAIQATPTAIDPTTGEVNAPAMAMDADADAVWLGFYNEVEGEQAPLGEYAGLRPFASRGAELARRLAAVLACFEGAQTIGFEIMLSACAIVRHSLSEWARYADAAKPDQSLVQAAALMDWLRDPRRADNWQAFTKRDLGKAGPPITRNTKPRDKLLAILVEKRHLLSIDGKLFTPNPCAASAASAATQQIRGTGSAAELRHSAAFTPPASPPGANAAKCRNSAADENPANTRLAANAANAAATPHLNTHTPGASL